MASDATEKLEAAVRAIDAANAEDPNRERIGGKDVPKELVYGQRMSAWVERLNPNAPEPLRIAARAQHIRRWEIPRSEFPEGRRGYHQWRTTLYNFHADKAEEILRDVGYDDTTITRVRFLLQKRDLKKDPDTQTLEDAAALVFLENHLAEFISRDDMDEDKLVDVIRKTWRKMSPAGHEAALTLNLPDQSATLVRKALA